MFGRFRWCKGGKKENEYMSFTNKKNQVSG